MRALIVNHWWKIFAIALVCLSVEGFVLRADTTSEANKFRPGQLALIVAKYDQIDRAEDKDIYSPEELEAMAAEKLEESEEYPFLEEIVVIDLSVPPDPLSIVQVLKTKGTRVLFGGQFYPFHGPFFGWVEQEHLIAFDSFKRVERWPENLLFDVCVEDYGCRKISQVGNKEMTISVSFSPFDDFCPFDKDHQGQCTTEGHVEVFDNYLRFVPNLEETEDEWDVMFIVQPDGRMCWDRALLDYDVCMPLRPEYYKPIIACDEAALTSAVQGADFQRASDLLEECRSDTDTPADFFMRLANTYEGQVEDGKVSDAESIDGLFVYWELAERAALTGDESAIVNLASMYLLEEEDLSLFGPDEDKAECLIGVTTASEPRIAKYKFDPHAVRACLSSSPEDLEDIYKSIESAMDEE
jgi:hypothetical protein